MTRKGKKKKELDPYEVLAERIPSTARDLVIMIHRINPTKEGVGPKEASDRYRLKAGLQSLLIRRFGEALIVEQADVNQPELIGIRLRHFDEDACHAMIHELDEDARSWVLRQIDEGQLDSFRESAPYRSSVRADPSAPPQEAEPVEERLSIGQLLLWGRKALEEYDYERSEALNRRALEMSEGDLEPALALLDILIEHLAAYEKALESAGSFSPSTLKDKQVRIRLAIAYARLNRMESALETIHRIVEPEAAQVYYLAAQYFIERQDEEQALEQLTALKACGSPHLAPETGQLERDIRALQERRLAPLEEEMLRSWQQGEAEKASALAYRLLSLMPDNKEARQIQKEIEKKERQGKAEHLLRLADEARLQRDFGREADLLRQVMALGEDKSALKQRLSEAQQELRRQREKMEMDDVAHLWSEGQRERALVSYAGLEASLRQRIRDRVQDRCFTWMEQALSASTTVKPMKLADAILILGKSAEALESGADPEPVISHLRLHHKILQCIPQAQNILRQAEARLSALEDEKSKKLLDETETCLGASDLPSAEERIEQLKTARLEGPDQRRFEEIAARFHRLRKIQSLQKEYEENVGRGDHLTSRRIAQQLAGVMEESLGRLWADKVAAHSAAVRKDWRLADADLDGLPECYESLGLDPFSERATCILLPDGRHVLMASALDRWIFLRAFDLHDQRIKKAYFLRAPERISFPCVTADGNSVWVNDLYGHVVQVGLDPFDIIFWQDFSGFIGEHEVCEEALLYPGSRCLWLKKRTTKGKREEALEIIHMDLGRSIRRIRSPAFVSRINAGGELRTALQDFTTKTVRICSDTGKVMDSFAFETKGTSSHGAIHPNGSDFIFLPFDDSGQMEPMMDPERQAGPTLTLEVKPDPEKKNRPFEISEANGLMLHSIATSLDAGIVFTFYYQDSEEDPGWRLAAWKPSEQGLKTAYRVRAPRSFMFACDERTRKVAGVGFYSAGIKMFMLDDRPPDLKADKEKSFDQTGIPSFDDAWGCSSPTGPLNAASLAFTMQLEVSDYEDQLRTIREMKRTASPDDLAGLVCALERLYRFDEARELRAWMREHYPDHHRGRIEIAAEAAKKFDWPLVIEALEGVSRTDLDDGTSRHLCHLLGMGYFVRGDVQKALGIWEEGLTFENGRCDLSPFIDYAKVSLRTPQWRRRRKTVNPIARTLSIFETVDGHLADGQWESAIVLIESEYPFARAEQQILARLAEAYLQVDYTPGEMRWVCKAIALAYYQECFKDSIKASLTLPPCIERWPEARLADIDRKAEQWLDR